MFRQFRHHQDHDGGGCDRRHQEHHARFGPGRDRAEGGFGAAREHFGRGFGGGGGRERMFDNGELQLVILHLLNEQPSYGYQLIKTMEERLSGGYAPSPGVIYPTLTMLEEEGFATSATADSGKKVYTATEEGKAHLGTNKRRLNEVLERLQQAGEGFQRGRSPQVMRAFMNLRGAVKARVTREGLTPEQLGKITDAINAAAKAIDEL